MQYNQHASGRMMPCMAPRIGTAFTPFRIAAQLQQYSQSGDMPGARHFPRHIHHVVRLMSTNNVFCLSPNEDFLNLSLPDNLDVEYLTSNEKARMEELQAAQQSTWDEKEKLSIQLEEERQNNVNAAIGQVHRRSYMPTLLCSRVLLCL